MFPKEICKPLEPDDYWKDYIANNFYYSNGNVYRKNRSKPIGTVNNHGYRIVRLGPIRNRKEKKNFKVHVLAWFLYYGIWPEDELDHENRKRDDNRIENLRISNRRDNLSRRILKKNEDPF